MGKAEMLCTKIIVKEISNISKKTQFNRLKLLIHKLMMENSDQKFLWMWLFLYEIILSIFSELQYCPTQFSIGVLEGFDDTNTRWIQSDVGSD